MNIGVPSPAGNVPLRERDSAGDADAHLTASSRPGSSKRRREQDPCVSDPEAGSALVGGDDANAAITAADSAEAEAEAEDGIDGSHSGDGDDGSEALERTVVVALVVEKVLHGGFQIGAAYCEGRAAPPVPCSLRGKGLENDPALAHRGRVLWISSLPALRHRCVGRHDDDAGLARVE